MGSLKYQKKPVWLDKSLCQIGKEPLAVQTGRAAAQAYKYLNLWLQQDQWFNFAGPPDAVVNPDWDDDDNTFYIIMWSPPKADASPANRYLGGALLPWNFHNHQPTGANSQGTIKWKEMPSGTEVTVWTSTGHKEPFYCTDAACSTFWGGGGSTLGSGVPWYTDAIIDPSKSCIELYRWWDGTEFDYLDWTPSGADWSWGRLTTQNMMVASLGMWPMPDPILLADQVQLDENKIEAGHVMRGYTGSGASSYGDLIHIIGDGTDAETEDTVEALTRRCLFQWGHPHGVKHTTTTKTPITGVAQPSGTDSAGSFRVVNREIGESSVAVFDSYPAVVVSASGAAEGTPGTVTFESGSDTWTLSITSDAVALYDYSDGSGALEISANTTDDVSIYLTAPTGGEIILHTASLWSAGPWY